MKYIGVVLSGCGVFDGSEIHEAVLTLLALDRAGVKVQCFAPDKTQYDVVNHCSLDKLPESRNVLLESARISRGNIQPLAQAKAEELDALIIPGGFGAAKNLGSFASEGENCHVDSELQALVQELNHAGKPLGFICIAPALAPKLLAKSVQVTIGDDVDTAQAIVAMGGKHINCAVDDVVVDSKEKVVSTPAYMLANSISDAAKGIDKLVANVLELCE